MFQNVKLPKRILRNMGQKNDLFTIWRIKLFHIGRPNIAALMQLCRGLRPLRQRLVFWPQRPSAQASVNLAPWNHFHPFHL